MIEVEDLPDTPPYFLIAPPVTKLPETATIVSSYPNITIIDSIMIIACHKEIVYSIKTFFFQKRVIITGYKGCSSYGL